MSFEKISRRRFVKNASTFTLGTMSAAAFSDLTANSGSAVPAVKRRPNVVFILADQWRAQALGCMGNTQVKTPHLDRFSQEGMLLENAISSYPLCTPYRAMLLSGRYPLSHGVVFNDILLPEDELTMGEVFKSAGYRTGYVGKWHLDGLDRGAFTPPGPRRQGFDYWRVCNCDHSYFKAFYYGDTPERIHIQGYEPDTQTDLAIDFINQNRNNPFFLFLSWGPPHEPYVAPKKYMDMYDPGTLKLRRNVRNANRKDIAGYYAHCTALDWNFSRLMSTLRESGLDDNTIVVFTSDHGDMLYSLDLKWKVWPYEESIRVPFIIRYPGTIPAGARSDVLLGTCDIMPSLLSLCGITIPDNVEGIDLSARFRGESRPDPYSAILMAVRPPSHYWERMGLDVWRGVRTKQYTYAAFRDRPWVLTDNVNDPFQIRNLVDDPNYQAVRRLLENDLKQWLERINDPFPPMREFPIPKYIGAQSGRRIR